MICLKNRTFAVSQTTGGTDAKTYIPLWFAWKIVLLQYRKQRLLPSFQRKLVVICLKNRTFAVSQTTFYRRTSLPLSCDLLEKSYFCSIANNIQLVFTRDFLLWFAWKIVLLQYRKQHIEPLGKDECSCDLLEKSYFCSIANNNLPDLLEYQSVVICLKNRTFAVSQTTFVWYSCYQAKLWFAWKIVLLQYRKQLVRRRKRVNLVVICLKNRTFAVSQTTSHWQTFWQWRCDLLEKSYFCSIANNQPRYGRFWPRLWFAWKIVLLQYRKQLLRVWYDCAIVVICLKNRTFAVSQTTVAHVQRTQHRLWFAWKIVLLQYRKQLVYF